MAIFCHAAARAGPASVATPASLRESNWQQSGSEAAPTKRSGSTARPFELSLYAGSAAQCSSGPADDGISARRAAQERSGRGDGGPQTFGGKARPSPRTPHPSNQVAVPQDPSPTALSINGGRQRKARSPLGGSPSCAHGGAPLLQEKGHQTGAFIRDRNLPAPIRDGSIRSGRAATRQLPRSAP